MKHPPTHSIPAPDLAPLRLAQHPKLASNERWGLESYRGGLLVHQPTAEPLRGLQIVQKRDLAVGLRSLSAAQFTRCNTRRLVAPGPQSPGCEARPLATRADGFAGPPSLCPAPPAAPSPRAPRFRLLGAPGGGERERQSPLTLPALGGGTAPLTFPQPPSLQPGSPTPLSSSQPWGTEPTLLQ